MTLSTSSNSQLLKVLIVENLEPVANRIHEILRAVECVGEVRILSDQEAFDSNNESLHSDVILLDLKSSRGSTASVLKRLRTHHKNAVVVVFANHSTKQYQELCLSSGADFYIDQTEFWKIPDLLQSLCN